MIVIAYFWEKNSLRVYASEYWLNHGYISRFNLLFRGGRQGNLATSELNDCESCVTASWL